MTNNNKKGLDRHTFEQCKYDTVTGIAGTCICDDGKGRIFIYTQTTSSAAQFWLYDAYADEPQQLQTPPTQTGVVANMVYTEQFGSQFSGKTEGSVLLFVGNGTVCYLYKYDIATNSWATLNTTGIPASFATDCYLSFPEPSRNNYESGYHSGVLRTLTTGSAVAVGATSITLSGATSETMPSGTRLRFGTFTISITANVAHGDTAIAVSALAQGIAAGTTIMLPNGEEVYTSSAVASSATFIPVYPVRRAILSGTVITVERFVVTTAIANTGATSLTISASLFSIENGATALYYGNMYLIGNNSTQMYRWNHGAVAWATTSANSGNPALPAVTGAVGAGCALKWLPAYSPDKLWILRGSGTANVYMYDLVANNMATETFHPSTETFTTGTSVASRTIKGKQATLLIQKDTTYRIYEGIPPRNRLIPKMGGTIFAHGSPTVGDRSCCLTFPDGVEFYFILLSSTSMLVRCALLDS